MSGQQTSSFEPITIFFKCSWVLIEGEPTDFSCSSFLVNLQKHSELVFDSGFKVFFKDDSLVGEQLDSVLKQPLYEVRGLGERKVG